MRKNMGKKSNAKMWWVMLLSVIFVSGCTGSGNNSAGSAVDLSVPSVSVTNPADAATGVAMDQKITATFSKGMNAATITAATFTLLQGTTPVAGAVSYEGTTAVFTPANTLDPNLSFTAALSTGVKDLEGKALATNKTWSFMTNVASGSVPDPEIKPTIE